MKLKILTLIFLFAAVNVFAQEMQLPLQDAQQQNQEEIIAAGQEKLLKKQLKEQQKQEKEDKKAEEKLKKEAEKKETARKKAEEKEKIENEKNQKIMQEDLARIEAEKIKTEEEEVAKAEKLQAKENRKQEKEEERLRKLEKKREIEAKKAERELSSSLILDYDLKFRAASYSNINYTSAKAEGIDIYSQYLSVNIIGKFDERIEMAAKLASYGISGKKNDAFLMPYQEDDFSFLLENAYLNFRSDTGAFVPYIFTFGKQPFTAGDGFIIDANQNGLLGARVKADITHLFSVDAFAGKVDNKDFNVYGASVKVKTATQIEVGIYQERNDTGFAYQKGVFVDSGAYAIKSDIKTFYDIRLTGGSQKYKYRLEAAQQTGELVKISTDTVEYDVFAFIAEGSWSGTLLKKASNAKVIFSYADAEKENAFNPAFARRYDGLQRIGYGSLFAAGSSDAFLTLPEGYGGINTIGVSFDIMPWDFMQTGLSFYMYSASDAPADAGDAGFSKIYGSEADLGNEIDFFVKYKYLNYFDIGLGIAMYTPPSNADKVFSNTKTSYLYQIEVNAKF